MKKNSMNISQIRNRITGVVSECLSESGFTTDKSPTFYHRKGEIVRLLHIHFLGKTDAAYFNSTTASFHLNLGVHFNPEDRADFCPEEYEAHIRGCLLRDFSQKHPMDLKGFSLFHPERRRRDIWWVDKNGSNLETLLAGAVRIIDKKAPMWLDQYSNVNTAVRFLKRKRESDPSKGGLFGVGSVGSPCRLDLIARLERRLQCRTET